MATFGDWLLKLGNSGAVRNAAVVVAERRAAEMRVEAAVQRLSEVRGNEWAAATRRRGIAS